MSSIELVVSHYNEDLLWLKKVPSNIKPIIYHKGVDIPNVGRESHTYIHHIISNYNNLADTTYFVQGHPHIHSRLFFELLASPITCPYWNLGYPRYIHDNKHGNKCNKRGFPVEKVWKTIFKTKCPEEIYFTPNGQFFVSKELILNHPISFYETCIKLLDYHINPPEGHCFERLWSYIFCWEETEENLNEFR